MQTHRYTAQSSGNMSSPISLRFFSVPIKRQKRPFILASPQHILYLSDLRSSSPLLGPLGVVGIAPPFCSQVRGSGVCVCGGGKAHVERVSSSRSGQACAQAGCFTARNT